MGLVVSIFFFFSFVLYRLFYFVVDASQVERWLKKQKKQKAPSQFLLYLFGNLYYPSRECCTTLIISMYIYIPLVLILPCLRCLLVIPPFSVSSSPSPPKYRIYMDTTVLYVRI